MATAVLRSHDCLKGKFHLDAFGSRPPPPTKSHRRRPSRPSPSTSPSPSSSPPKPGPVHPNRSSPPTATKPGRSNPVRSGRRKSPSPEKDNQPRRPLVMEEVTILKRREGFASPLCSTNPIGPDPEVLPRKISFPAYSAPIYAGPAFCGSSPEPSSLPIPTSFLRKAGGLGLKSESEDATRGLRCLLRLGDLA